jgi:DNA repair ATPase RecN
MGDLMTMTAQPRHIKLGLAGKQENWIYAKYELSELRNAFGRIARAIPKYQSIDTAALTTAIMQAALNTLGKSIDANSAAQFTEAYTQLTEACNACHRNRNHAAVAIKVPDATMFPDQEFLPPKW